MEELGLAVEELDEAPDLSELQRSLFGSTYTEPVPVYLKLARDLTLPVVVTGIQSVFVAADGGGCLDHPDFEFGGWIMRSGFDPNADIVRVKIKLITGETGQVEGANVRRT